MDVVAVETILAELQETRRELSETRQEVQETRRLLEKYHNPNRWISVKEAAEIADVSERQIFRCVKSGEIFSRKFGGSRRVSLASLVAYTAERAAKATA